MAIVLCASRFDPRTLPDGVAVAVALTDWWWRPSATAEGRLLPYGAGLAADLGRFARLLDERLPAGAVVALDIEPGAGYADPAWPWVAMPGASEAERDARSGLIVRTLETVGTLYRFGREWRPDLDWRVYGISPVRDQSVRLGVDVRAAAEASDALVRQIVGFESSGVSMYRSARQSLGAWEAEAGSLVARAAGFGDPVDGWFTGFYVGSGVAVPAEELAAQYAMASSAYGWRDAFYWADGGRPRPGPDGPVYASFGRHRPQFELLASLAGGAEGMASDGEDGSAAGR